MTDSRRVAELRDGLARTEERIRAACAAAHRDRAEVSLIVTTSSREEVRSGSTFVGAICSFPRAAVS